MLYVKQEICDGVTITFKITSDNIYADCLGCGRELQVDLDSGKNDFHVLEAFCKSCWREIFAEQRRRKHGDRNKCKEDCL